MTPTTRWRALLGFERMSQALNHHPGQRVPTLPREIPHQPTTGNPPYSISPYSAVKRYIGKGDTTLHDAPPLQSAGRISNGAARRYHLVAVPPLDLGAMLTADRP